MTAELAGALEDLIRRDPAQRGLLSSQAARGPLCVGQLGPAARHLAEQGRSVAIVTGFFIPLAVPPGAETDGPLGAALLAATLAQLGMKVVVITDRPCAAVVEAALQTYGFPEIALEVAPIEPEPFEAWLAAFWQSRETNPLTHLISIERVGATHTRESLGAQPRDTAPPWHEFELAMAEGQSNRSYNMRGICIDDWTAPLYRLFETHRQQPVVPSTIGVGDGGNEIGMGVLLWEDLSMRLPIGSPASICCRVATDWTILAGVSNWGGMALAGAVAAAQNRTDILAEWDCAHHERALHELLLVGAVDGITRTPTPSVDGLPFLTYVQPWRAIREALGLTA